MELVSEEEEFAEIETQFHVDMEQEPSMMSLTVVTSSLGQASVSDGSNKTIPTDDGCRGEEATPPCLGPTYSARQVMRNVLSENLDIHMKVLQCFSRAVCFQNGKVHGVSA